MPEGKSGPRRSARHPEHLTPRNPTGAGDPSPVFQLMKLQQAFVVGSMAAAGIGVGMSMRMLSAGSPNLAKPHPMRRCDDRHKPNQPRCGGAELDAGYGRRDLDVDVERL